MRAVRKRETPSAAPARHALAPGRRIGAALLAATVITLATETYLIVADRTVSGARVPRTDQSFLVEGLGQGHRISQTFVMRADGLDGIRLNAVAQGETDQGELALALYEVTWDQESAAVGGAERLLFRDRVAVDTATRHPTFLFAVPPSTSRPVARTGSISGCRSRDPPPGSACGRRMVARPRMGPCSSMA